MKENIDVSLLFYLHSLKLNLSSIEILRQWEQTKLLKHKLLTDLEKYGYTFDDMITTKGEELLFEVDNWVPMETLNRFRNKAAKEKTSYNRLFQEWLDLYPKSPNFEIGGKQFTGTRSLHTKKEECQVKYLKILDEKKVSHQQLLDCLQKEVEMRHNESFRKGSNEIQYMKATISYLNSRSWEIYLPLINRENEIKSRTFVPTQNLF